MVQLEKVGKRYVKYDDAPMLITSALRLRSGTARSHLWALRDVDLSVAPGEAVGVIGRNGAGKSTMLRILAGITSPTEGRVRVAGRVAPLISVGVGFHPELTGRENVYVNGTVLGMTRAEIDRRFDAILDFAEISDFIDTPVKFYSSGMFVRLGFAVAVAAEPDVLLVDEVLAVGDIAFQMKCFDRMRELQEAGATMLLVSHNLNAVRNLADRVLVIRHGKPVFLGDTDAGISAYYQDLGDVQEDEVGRSGPAGAPIEILEFDLVDDRGSSTRHVVSMSEIAFRITARFRSDVQRPTFGLALHHASGIPVYMDSTYGADGPDFKAGESATCVIRLPARLTTGAYSARASAHWGGTTEDHVSSDSVTFHVSGSHLVAGVVDLGAQFEVSPAASPASD